LIESLINLFFTGKKLPLMSIKDIFLQIDEKTFTLNLVMSKG